MLIQRFSRRFLIDLVRILIALRTGPECVLKTRELSQMIYLIRKLDRHFSTPVLVGLQSTNKDFEILVPNSTVKHKSQGKERHRKSVQRLTRLKSRLLNPFTIQKPIK